jgi:hypothetical protein
VIRKISMLLVLSIALAACTNRGSTQPSFDPQSLSTSGPTLTEDELRSQRITQRIAERYDQFMEIDGSIYKVQEIEDPDLMRIFEDVIFYQATIFVSSPPENEVIAYDGKSAYLIPSEINLVIESEKIEITEENVQDIAYAYAKLADPAAIPYLEIIPESIVLAREEAFPFILEFQTNSALGGLVTEWKFWINLRNDVQKVVETLVAKEEGEWIEPDFDYQKQWRSLNYSKISTPRCY